MIRLSNSKKAKNAVFSNNIFERVSSLSDTYIFDFHSDTSDIIL
jgi:hypothetical protein